MGNRAVISALTDVAACWIIDHIPLIIALTVTLLIGWIVFNRHDPS